MVEFLPRDVKKLIYGPDSTKGTDRHLCTIAAARQYRNTKRIPAIAVYVTSTSGPEVLAGLMEVLSDVPCCVWNVPASDFIPLPYPSFGVDRAAKIRAAMCLKQESDGWEATCRWTNLAY